MHQPSVPRLASHIRVAHHRLAAAQPIHLSLLCCRGAGLTKLSPRISVHARELCKPVSAYIAIAPCGWLPSIHDCVGTQPASPARCGWDGGVWRLSGPNKHVW